MSMKGLVQYFSYRDVHLGRYSPFVAWRVRAGPVEGHCWKYLGGLRRFLFNRYLKAATDGGS